MNAALIACMQASTDTRTIDVDEWCRLWQSLAALGTGAVAQAITGGFAADRVGWAFAGGYPAALRALLPSLPHATLVALCVTEAEGNRPRHIRTTITPQEYNKKDFTLQQATDALSALGYSVAASEPAAQALSGAPGPASAPKSTFLDKEAGAQIDAPSEPLRRAQLSSTPAEDFQDRLAAAQVVRNELNDIRLDDLHDLAGNTLYRFTFDTTVVPDNDTSAWAVVRAKIKLSSTEIDGKQLLRLASTQYVRSLSEANEASYRTMLNSIKGSCWKQEVEKVSFLGVARTGSIFPESEEEPAFRRAFLCATKDMGSASRRRLEAQLAGWSSSGGPTALADPSNDVAKQRGRMQDLLLARPENEKDADGYPLRKETLRRWAQWLAEIFDRQTLTEFSSSALACFQHLELDASLGGAFPYQSRMRNERNQSAHCADVWPSETGFEQALKKHLTASVYASTPKESVQRLSEVSSNRKTTELLLGLSAIASTAGVNAAIQSIKSNTALYESIRRQPLVVGFTEVGNVCSNVKEACDGELVFGWILGPSFLLSADGKSSMFRHSVAQRSVAATLSLPAWLDAVKVTVETSWRRENGTTALSTDSKPVETQAYTVHLPATPADALSSLDTSAARGPRVDRYQYLDVVEGEPAAVLITGRDLWRSTQVFIGAQRATSLSVLPTYRGIVASFDKITAMAGSAVSLNFAEGFDLTVQTSEGSTLAGHVLVKRRDQKNTEPQKATVGVSRVVAGSEVTASLAVPLAATDEPVVQVTTPKDVSFLALLADSTLLNQDRKTVVFALPAKAVPNLKSGDVLATALAVKHGRTGATEIFPIQKEAVYYTSADDAKATLPATMKLSDPIKLTIKLPAKAVVAYGDLRAGSVKAIARAQTDASKDELTLVGTCIVAKNKDRCEVRLDGDAGWKALLAKSKEVNLTVTLDGKDVPAFLNDKVNLKR